LRFLAFVNHKWGGTCEHALIRSRFVRIVNNYMGRDTSPRGRAATTGRGGVTILSVVAIHAAQSAAPNASRERQPRVSRRYRSSGTGAIHATTPTPQRKFAAKIRAQPKPNKNAGRPCRRFIVATVDCWCQVSNRADSSASGTRISNEGAFPALAVSPWWTLNDFRTNGPQVQRRRQTGDVIHHIALAIVQGSWRTRKCPTWLGNC